MTKNKQPKSHYFSLTFMSYEAGTTIHNRVVVNNEHKRVTEAEIKKAAALSEAGDMALLMSCSYLGKMTQAEFEGDNE